MKKILNELFEHKKLNKESAREVLINISRNQYNDAQIAAFISVYLMRTISVEELEGFRSALLELCLTVDLEERDTIDLCGTGGDGKNTFNISTLASLVVAGAGYMVAKHGNYGVSSACGSSNVLEYLGYQFTNNSYILKKQIDQAHICFFHAPLFHPALKGVGPIRKQLGVKTFFNMLGPLVNPAQPYRQVVGVFSFNLARLYQYLYEKLDKEYIILHGVDGYDEVSLTAPVKLIKKACEMLETPAYFGMPVYSAEEIFGGNTIEEAATTFIKVLDGKGTNAQNDVVIANAALGIQCFHPGTSIEDCLYEARESLFSGRARQTLRKLLEIQP
ncbi:MAG TPA: anthranilate phosphoribosyltransferase [Saprospiraceae bacterium]|nr:anthranilate phosphoribosyltransferase [Saprospiraceae bacterium]